MAETFQSLYLISAIKVFMGSSFHLQSELSPLLLLPLPVFTGGGCETSSCARSFHSQLIIVFNDTLQHKATTSEWSALSGLPVFLLRQTRKKRGEKHVKGL